MEYAADYHHAMAQQLNSNQIHQLHPHQIPMLSAAGLNLTVSSPNQVMSCGVSNSNNTGQQIQVQATNTGQQAMYQNIQTVNAGQLPPGTQMMVVHHINHGHGSSKKKKPKVNKDGIPAPKRATTAYINFTQWYREELKKAGRTIPKIGEFGKECAGKWNGMTDEEKSPFLNHAAKDRERYRKEMAIYKPARDANKPKRPGTAFMLFMGDFRKEMAGKEPEGGVAALAKLGGERWRGMSEEDKRPYVEKQNEEKIRYEVSMEDYRRKTAGMTPNQAVGSGDVTSPKQVRLSTEGSDIGSPEDNSDSGGGNGGEQMMSDQDHQAQNMVVRQQSESSPSPGTSCSSPQAQTMSPSPIQQQQQQQTSQQNQQTQSIQNNSNNNNMSSLPPLSTAMSLSHAITNHTTALMAGYPQHTFTANFGHPGTTVLTTGATTAAVTNYNQAHSGNMSSSSPSYLQSGAGGNYTNQSHLPGHYTWN